MANAERISINLPSDMLTTIKDRVSSGDYNCTSKVIREAMRLGLRREQEHVVLPTL